MDTWQGWAAAIFGFILSIVGLNYRTDKKRMEDAIITCKAKTEELAERVVKVESVAITAVEVLKLLNDVQRDISEIKIQLAKLPKRSGD